MGDSCFLISKFVLKHSITNTALSDLLKIIEMHCPNPNLCCKSVYFLKKYLNSSTVVGGADIACTTHEYCANCSARITDSKSPHCTNCKLQMKGAADRSEFTIINIEDQLRTLFKCKCAKPLFTDQISYFNILN